VKPWSNSGKTVDLSSDSRLLCISLRKKERRRRQWC
jgi:hypothetical protein